MANDKGQIEVLDSRSLKVRIIIGAAILCALVFGWFAVRWQLGNMLATLTTSADQNAEQIAEYAVNLAPSDPEPNWLLAETKREVFSPDETSSTINSYKKIVKLSPFDFRWWIELGRGFEQMDNYDEAEKAYLRAIELAPSYTTPHWQLGNFYLRRNRSDEAFGELKKAAETNPVYRDQVFSLAWDYYNQDKAKLEQIVGDKPIVRAGLARFYAAKELAGDSLRVWNMLSPEEKQANPAYAKVIADAFYQKRIYPQAMEFYRGLGIEPDAKAETIQNAGFEKPIGDNKDTYFGWQITAAEKMEVKLDATQKHEGNRSLRIFFNGYFAPTLYNITQIVIVEPSAKYLLTFWVRTENLKSGGNPALEIYNAKTDANLVTSAPFPGGTNDWQQVKLEFVAPSDAQSIAIRTTRIYCGEVCPIVGTFWYDDFRLEKIK
ncbi:hypothetical protein BH20ACI1_BH20ACI1_08940 [soil metagenome]